MKNINSDFVGTLPDFGSYNFCVERGDLDFEGLTSKCKNQYDKYIGVKNMRELGFLRTVDELDSFDEKELVAYLTKFCETIKIFYY